MTRYTYDEETRVRTLKQVRAWQRSGLVDEGQANVMAITLATDLRRTHLILRIVLFGFASLVLQSGVFLLAITLGLDGEWAGSAITIALAAASTWAAETAIARYRLYRFGVEEAAAVWAVALAATSLTLLATSVDLTTRPERVAVAAVALGAAALYARYGYLYAALAAVGCTAALPFVYGVPQAAARLMAAGLLLASCGAAARARRPHGDEYPGDDYGMMGAVAWLGAYAVLNLPLTFGAASPDSAPLFYWGTFAAVWVLPAAGLVMGVRGRDRALIRASALMAVASLFTVKMYLRLPVQEWDPIVLGVVLAGIALGVRRWLLAGPGEQRAGFTPRALLYSDARSAESLGIAAGLSHGAASATSGATPPGYEPGGGSSGGAGASGRF